MTTKEKMNTNKITARIADISLRKAAIVAGIGFLMSFIGAIFATLFVDIGDAATTANNIMFGVFGFLIAILGDMVRAWALYVFFKQVNKSLALFSAWFMLVHDAIFGAAQLKLVFGSVLLSGADYLKVLEPNQMHALALLFSNVYTYGFQIGLFFFSFHLGILGYLVYKSGFAPRILSILLIVASLGYLINSIGTILSPNFPEIIWTVLMGPCLIGELALIVWLVIKGGKRPTEG
jgi:hypothetical protein